MRIIAYCAMAPLQRGLSLACLHDNGWGIGLRFHPVCRFLCQYERRTLRPACKNRLLCTEFDASWPPCKGGWHTHTLSMRCGWGIGCTPATAACGLVDSEQGISFYCNKIPPAKILGIFATSLFKGGMDCPSILLYCIVLQQ